MSKMRGCLLLAVLMVAAIAACLAYLDQTGFWAADACLDRGGSYHYDRAQCSFTESYRGDVPPLWPF